MQRPKPIFSYRFGVCPYSFPKEVFVFLLYWLSLGKMDFSAQTHLFPRKTLVFLRQTISFLGRLDISSHFSKQRMCISLVVCARYELVLPIRFVERQYYWDSIPLSRSFILYNQDMIQISFGRKRIGGAIAAPRGSSWGG